MERTDKRTLLKVAVGVGTVGLLLIGYAVSGPGTVDRSQNERSNESSIVAGSTGIDDVVIGTLSPEPQVSADPSATADENLTSNKTGTYTVAIQPSDAQLTVRGDGILVTGEGGERKIAVSDSSQVLSFVLTASRPGFKTYAQTIPITTSDKTLDIRLEELPVVKTQPFEKPDHRPTTVQRSGTNTKQYVSTTKKASHANSNAGKRVQDTKRAQDNNVLTALEKKFVGKYRSVIVNNKRKANRKQTHIIDVKADRKFYRGGKAMGEWREEQGVITVVMRQTKLRLKETGRNTFTRIKTPTKDVAVDLTLTRISR